MEIGELATAAGLYEEAIEAYQKGNLHVCAVRVLVDQLKDLRRAFEYANVCDDPEVWR